MSEKLKPAQDNLRGIFLDADETRIIIIELPLKKKGKRIYGELCLAGDFHYGHEEFSRNVLNGYLNYFIQNKHIQFGLMGDYVNYAEASPFIADEEIRIDEQITEFCADWRPFKDRIKFILWGNHDERFARLTKSHRFLRNLALEIGINEKGCYINSPQRGLLLIIKAGDIYYGGYVHHGSTNARINRKLQLERMGTANQVCFIAHGHTHELSWGERRTFGSLEFINGKAKKVIRRQFLLTTGTFLRYPSYAEAKSYPYTDVGCPILKFYADQAEIEIYDLTSHYKEYLARGGSNWQGERQQLSEDFKISISPSTCCPRCGSLKTGSKGRGTKGRQRRVCKECNRHFTC